MHGSTMAALAIVGAAAFAGPALAEDGPCAKWREAGLIEGFDCASVEGGAVIANSARQDAYAEVLPQAFASFAQFFASSEQKVALVVRPNVPPALAAALRADGYKPLPWIDSDTKAAMRRDSIVAQVEAQTASLPEAQRAAVVQQALAKVEASAPVTVDPAIEDGAIAHEIGHLLFSSYFDGPARTSGERSVRYGSSAPDWLDEAAAVALENEELTRRRYAAARTAYEADGTVLAFSLDAYLTMEHPSLRAALALRTINRGGAEAMILSGDEAKAFLEDSGGNPEVFYRQTRLFIDFLMEKSGDLRILHKIAQEHRDGRNLADWLAQAGRENGLPTTQPQLETEFEAWARAKLAAPDSRNTT